MLPGMFWAGVLILAFGLVKLLFVPLSMGFEFVAWRRRRRKAPSLLDQQPMVSVIVPGYNEANVINNCVESVVASSYRPMEVILVDDGSTDNTAELMAALAAKHPVVTFVAQPNAGKGAALNNGAQRAKGQVLMFVDADGIFTAHTIEDMLAGFTDSGVGAVCGDDRPVNLNKVQTQLLTVISHIGTGLVRRGLTVLHVMPIVSGNIGAFRRDVLDVTGPLDTKTLGEDLDLTWRIYKAGYRVRYNPRALVYAESPSTIKGLWKQRVRWARGLLQCLRIHWRMIGNPAYGVFGAFMAFNALTMVVVPLLQLLVVALIPLLVAGGANPVPPDAWGVVGWIGLLTAVFLAVFSMGINKAWGDLRYLWTLPLWPVYSLFVGATMFWAVVQEVRGASARWNKLERTGVVSIPTRSLETL
ncbi:glycosyltransferase [Pseudarthrobacter sp. J1763]|uniref:glycosyltransferase n=1 Tax=Pseudarthrobacter sp. J1763 TaxID=3420445 RepID=UPI003D2E24BB